jgi:hypothetical protein
MIEADDHHRAKGRGMHMHTAATPFVFVSRATTKNLFVCLAGGSAGLFPRRAEPGATLQNLYASFSP